ncbi:conserved hypothetical protein [Talaromyces stipitatus ATCC 10500]|uniref:DUF6924 domain-containing protein n=1 Tax=Talaromyces stipitatus (strain ATCC 10500 / CBS 375.48 / QM 6759 / NRRL 1006) TaxID=441959 RepID=B8MSE4_TALSN|nr:uncharacterized protein TSTA_003870 [Talaromyces stipitatus ATCC 10500]EED12331.1 conserved hypothetical protein [Talaromyces stipitatus ATCC 10500]
MVELWPVFLTAPEVNIKALNKALLLLQDFQFAEEIPCSNWFLMTSKDMPTGKLQPTTPPHDPDGLFKNEFAGMSMDEINDFLWDNTERFEKAGLTCYTWLIIDVKGLETDTSLVAQRVFEYDEDTETGSHVKSFRAARLPYERVWDMYCNLDVANMDFEDWVDESGGIQEDGTWKWAGPFPLTNEGLKRAEEERKAKIEKALEEMRRLGHID